MQHKMNWRRFLNLTPVFLLCVAVAVACRDSLQPQSKSDEWAGSVIEQMQVTTQMRLFDERGHSFLLPRSQPTTMSAMTWPVIKDAASDGSVFAKRPLVRYRHTRDSSGSVLTLAFIQDGNGAPPTRVYGFRDGVIQFVFNPQYKQRGNRWVRDKVRLTAFKDGKPLAQFDASAVAAEPANLRFAPADASYYDDSELVDEQSGSGSCWRERAWSVVKWTAFVAIAGGSLAGAVEACPLSGAATATCVEGLLGPGSAAAGAALLYIESMQALVDCEWRLITGPSSTSGGTSSTSGTSTTDSTLSGLLKVVDTFIAASEAGGGAYCTPNGEYCVYYPPQV